VIELRKIDLTPYTVEMRDQDGNIVAIPYNIRESIESVMTATGNITTQRLSMNELLRNYEIAQKIRNAKENYVLLEENEYQRVLKSFQAFRGFSRNEVEMCKRIKNAETVEVTEKKRKKQKP